MEVKASGDVGDCEGASVTGGAGSGRHYNLFIDFSIYLTRVLLQLPTTGQIIISFESINIFTDLLIYKTIWYCP